MDNTKMDNTNMDNTKMDNTKMDITTIDKTIMEKLELDNTSNEQLDELHHMLLMEYMPLIVFTSIMLGVGILGNALTVRYYNKNARKSSTTIFIIALAWVDLFVCCVGIGNVAGLAVNVHVSTSSLCKIGYFINHWTVFISVLILWVIAIDRYRKVCCTNGWQFDAITALKTIIAVIVFSCVTSIPHIFTIDVIKLNFILPRSDHSTDHVTANPRSADKTVVLPDVHPTSTTFATFNNTIVPKDSVRDIYDPTTNNGGSLKFVSGNHCTHTDEEHLQLLFTFTSAIDAVFIFAVFVTFIVTYSRMCIKIRNHRKTNTSLGETSSNTHDKVTLSDNILSLKKNKGRKQSDQSTLAKKSIDQSESSILSCDRHTDHKTARESDFKSTTEESIISVVSPSQSSKRIRDNTTVRRVSKASKNSLIERSLTVMMCAVSIGYVVCFTPYFVIVGGRISYLPLEDEYRGWIQFILRTPIYNSVINPIIYCCFNPQFRRYVKQIFRRCWCK